MYCYKNRHVEQCSRIKYPNISTHNYSHLTFDEEAENILWRKDSNFNESCWEN